MMQNFFGCPSGRYGETMDAVSLMLFYPSDGETGKQKGEAKRLPKKIIQYLKL